MAGPFDKLMTEGGVARRKPLKRLPAAALFRDCADSAFSLRARHDAPCTFPRPCRTRASRAENGGRVNVAETGSVSRPVGAAARAGLLTGYRDLAARVERWSGFVPWAILLYFVVQAALRVALSGNLEIDEAEIARHGYLAFGYGNSNPPLYDWIVVSLWKLTGSWPAALALAKNGLLAATYLLFFRLGRRLLGTKAGAATLALSLMLMPQVIWHAQVTLSHSTAALAASAAVIATLAWLIERRATLSFVAFGVALAAALLSKYSAILLVAALACGVLGVGEARRRLRDLRLLLSMAVAALLAAPHYVWVLRNLEISTARLAKLETRHPFWSLFDIPLIGLDGLWSTLQVLAVSAAPLVIIWAAARWLARGEADLAAPRARGDLFGGVARSTLIAGLAIVGIVVLASDIHHISDRYLAQFLLVLPVWLATCFPLAFRPRAMRRFLATSLGLALAATIAWPQLALFGKHRYAYPYDAIAQQVPKVAGPAGAILM